MVTLIILWKHAGYNIAMYDRAEDAFQEAARIGQHADVEAMYVYDKDGFLSALRRNIEPDLFDAQRTSN